MYKTSAPTARVKYDRSYEDAGVLQGASDHGARGGRTGTDGFRDLIIVDRTTNAQVLDSLLIVHSSSMLFATCI